MSDGPTDNILEIIVKDEKGVDVSENYDITYKYGTLSITKRSVDFRSKDGEWVTSEFEFVFNTGKVHIIHKQALLPYKVCNTSDRHTTVNDHSSFTFFGVNNIYRGTE